MDAAFGDELGLLPLRELVQSRAGLCVLRHPRSNGRCCCSCRTWPRCLAQAARICGAPAVRAARSQQQDRTPLAPGRTRAAAGRLGSRAGAARVLRQRVRLSHRDGDARSSILMGFVVDLCALGILLARRRTQTPEDYQRVRWVIWGCLIGLPAFLIAELASTTTIFDTRWGDFTPSEDIIGLLYLVNGVLCLFVFEALRRPRVVSVMIPLRRVTILGLMSQRSRAAVAPRGRAHRRNISPAGLGVDRHGRGRRVPPHPPARRRRASRRPLFQQGGGEAEQRLGQAHPHGQEGRRDRPAAGGRDLQRAEARFRRLVPPRGAGVRARRQRQRLGPRQGEDDQGRRADAGARVRRQTVPLGR